jgi:hypothetical protein
MSSTSSKTRAFPEPTLLADWAKENRTERQRRRQAKGLIAKILHQRYYSPLFKMLNLSLIELKLG